MGMIVQGANVLLGLLVRTFFIYFLSQVYLGVNGLFTNILTMLSLAEMGIGSAIIYDMYKPIAEGDEIQIAKLMNFYRQAYFIIGCVVGTCGLLITPFLGVIIKGQPDIPNITEIYLLYLANTVFSYFFAYKRSIFSADQRERVLHIFRLIFYIVRSVLQIIILMLTKNFIAYLGVQILCTVLENVAVSIYADREYPFLKKYQSSKLDKKQTKSIVENVKALFIYKVGSTALDGTDNIIISAFDGVISVGLLSNYSLVTGSVQLLLSQITTSLTSSVGNYVAQESNDKHEMLLKRLTFLNFIIYGGAFVILTSCLTPFVQVWAGTSYTLGFSVVFVFCLNMYIYGMMNSIWTFRTTMGLFVYGRWRPLVSAAINVVVSILLAQKMGLLGVLLGTTITRVTTNVWFDPYVVYRYGLKKSASRYYIQWLGYLILCCILVFALNGMICALPLYGMIRLVVSALFSSMVFGVAVVVLFWRNEHLRYFIDIIKNMVFYRVK
ncbi:sugar translocase [Pseudoflavonifractor sp. An187]|uniref:lipopolysaccharide biosynthesis protein n=1 Tax=Pseudoflavonifractor sp. An187 TaxID=1965578 RepID=UPI00194FDA70|nr:sugar translocase [Pseudoflavonifractor sp. An187]